MTERQDTPAATVAGPRTRPVLDTTTMPGTPPLRDLSATSAAATGSTARTAATAPHTVAADGEDREAAWAALTRRGVQQARRSWMSVQLIRLGVLVAVIAVWQLAGTYWIDPFYVSTPADVGTRLGEWARDGSLASNLWSTVHVMLEGFVLGAVAGTIVGVVLGLNRFAGRILDPFIQALYSIPKIALAPIFILWLGVGDTMRIILTAVVVFFIVFWTAYGSVRDVDRELVDVVRLMGGKRRHTVFKVVLPGALPGILHGFKISIPYALIGTIVAELLASNSGIGYLMQSAQNQYDTAGLFAGLIALMVVAVILDGLLTLVDRYATRWQPTA